MFLVGGLHWWKGKKTKPFFAVLKFRDNVATVWYNTLLLTKYSVFAEDIFFVVFYFLLGSLQVYLADFGRIKFWLISAVMI